MDFLDFRIFGEGVNRAHGRHSGSSAMLLAEVIHEIRLKINKNPKMFSNDFRVGSDGSYPNHLRNQNLLFRQNPRVRTV